jgi:hypothetical protein
MGKLHTVQALLSVGVIVLAAGSAKAQSSSSETPPSADAERTETSTASRWYGWQTLATDGAAITLVVIGVDQGAGDPFSRNRHGEAIALTGLGTYLVGAPAVHAFHRRAGAAMGSLALRVGAPAAGFLAASTLEGCVGSDNADSCASRAEGVGILFGIGTAMALDAAFLARESVEAARGRRTASASRARVAPGFAVTSQSRALVLTGSF